MRVLKKNIIIMILFTLILTACGNEENEVQLSSKNTEQAKVTSENEKKSSDTIYVYVRGEVKRPGVFQIKKDARLYQVIEMAGGMTKSAQPDYLNLAETVVDGENVKVLSKKQYKKQKNNQVNNSSEVSTIVSSNSELININTASNEELVKLTGIGETRADAIITYRKENGAFKSIEDIKNVSGIGDATFNNIKDKITV